MLTKNKNLGLYLANNDIPAKAHWAGFEQILTGYEQVVVRDDEVEVGVDENSLPVYELRPIYGNGEPIYEQGEEQFELVWDDPENPGVEPTEEELEAFVPPPPEPPAPLTDLDRITKILAGHEAEAPQRITRLKAEVSLAMIAYAGFNPTSANAEGSRFVVHHAAKIAAFNLAGGNVVAGRALYDTIAESTGDFAWLNQEMGEGGPSILSIFAARLVAQ